MDSNDNLADFDPKFETEVHHRNGFIHPEIIIWSIEKNEKLLIVKNFCKQSEKDLNQTVNQNALIAPQVWRLTWTKSRSIIQNENRKLINNNFLWIHNIGGPTLECLIWSKVCTHYSDPLLHFSEQVLNLTCESGSL